MLTYRDIKVRYKQSVMGFLWAILMPILIVMSGVVVRFAYSIVSPIAPLKTADVASVAVKSVPWAFTVSSIRFTCNSLRGNFRLSVSKVSIFPRKSSPWRRCSRLSIRFRRGFFCVIGAPVPFESRLEHLSAVGSGIARDDCNALPGHRHDLLGTGPFLQGCWIHRRSF